MLARFKQLSADAIIAAPASGLAGILLGNAFNMSVPVIVLCCLLAAISLWGVFLRRRVDREARVAQRARFFLDELPGIPQDEASESDWHGWTAKEEALLRGAGMLRKSRVLKQVVGAAPASDRRFVAANFFRGLAQEATEEKISAP